MVAPGTYTARVTVGHRSYSQTFQVLQSPHSHETPAQIAARVGTLLHIRNDISSVSVMVNQIEWLRRQLQTVKAMLKNDKRTRHKKMLLAIKKMSRKIQDVENLLLSPALANSDEKSYLAPYSLYLNLIWLNGELGTGAGDVYGHPGYRPTEATMQVLRLLDQRLAAAKTGYQTLMEQDLRQFDQMLIHDNILPLVARARVPAHVPLVVHLG